MKNLVKWLDKYFEEVLLVALLGAMAVIMLLQVIMRYFFSSALAWPEEVCRYLYIWSCFLGISYCIGHGSELKIDLFEKIFRGKARAVFQILLQVICLGLYLVMFYSSVSVLEHIYTSGQTSAAARIPMYLVYLSIPFSMALALVRSVQKTVRLIGNLRKPSHKEVEGGEA